MATNEFDKIKPGDSGANNGSDGADSSLEQTVDDILNEIAKKKNGDTGDVLAEQPQPVGAAPEPPPEEPRALAEDAAELAPADELPLDAEDASADFDWQADEPDALPIVEDELESEPEPEPTGEQLVDDFFENLQSTSGKAIEDEPKKKKAKKSDAPKPERKKGMSKSAKRVWNKVLKIALGIFCVVVILGCAAAVGLSIYLMSETQNDDTELDLMSIKLSYATIFYAQNPDYDAEDETSQQWIEYQRIYGEENRQWIDYDEMPDHLINALVASEDKRFWTHGGVDWRRTLVAFVNFLPGVDIGSAGGGSTIDQQLIKNITDEKDSVGIEGALRKVREIYRALALEKRFSKEQILESYLNTFRLSGKVAGIESAANTYFDKTTKELTIAECAAILCITKAPTANDPLQNPQTNKEQRDYIIWSMFDQGYLNQSEYDAAMRDSDTLVFGDYAEKYAQSGGYSYFTETAIDEVLKDLEEMADKTPAEAYDMLFNQGLAVYLTIDLDIQQVMEDELVDSVMESNYDSDHVWPNEDMLLNEIETTDSETGETIVRTEPVQGAAVVMNMDGELMGIIGSMYEKTEDRGWNRAYDATRSPGSSIKPLAAYAPAIETDKIHYSTLFPDSASRVINGQQWPRNWSNSYGEPITVYEAVQQSLNTTAVYTLDRIGEEFSFDFMTTRFGISSLVSPADNPELNDMGPAITLGDLTKGVSVYEMAAAYAVFGNGGEYVEPHCYSRVAFASGETIIDKSSSVQRVTALSSDTAYIMNKMLQGVVSGGTGTSARFSTQLPIAGKSGTTSDNKDYWFVGLTPYYVCAVWQGFDTPGYMYTWRPHPTQKAFRAVMGPIHEGLEYKNFPQDETNNVTSLPFCKQSGELATAACPETITGYYKSDNVPNECVHVFVPTDPAA